MTEIEYVIKRFDKQFHMFKGSNIVLHGSRKYAEAIIDHFNDEYNFIGIMSKDYLKGDYFHGLRVLKEEVIPQLDIDIVILTERAKYAEEVYQSINQICKERGIHLYDMYGLDQIQVHAEIDQCRSLSFDEWVTLCSAYDMVAFEVMDTLNIVVPSKWFGNEKGTRPVFQKLIPRLFADGKDVRLSLRKSCPEDVQISLLKEAGLFPDLDRLLIRRKGEDLSFRTLKENNPGKKILYIGSGLVNECILPRCYGIDTYRYIESDFDCLAPMPGEDYIRSAYEENFREQVVNTIVNANVVSFDVFDTLIQRMTLYPTDVFYIVESKAKAEGLPADHFKQKRMEAERALHLPDIYEIYDVLENYYGWSTEEKERVLELELSVERQVIVPRVEIVELLTFAIEQGKTVVLTSDMYLPEQLLREILSANGIEGYSELFVSCDMRQSKYDGLYESLIPLCADTEKILHIGNDIRADGECCEKSGMKSIILPSALAMACAGNWRNSVECAKSLMERCLIGITVSELFRDPFRNPNTKEVPSEERLRRFAMGVSGPLVTGYLTWLISKVRENGIDKVLFLSRDGYLPEKIYRSIRSRHPLPESVYFHANRHSAFLTIADDTKAAEWIALVCEKYGMKGIDILKNIYNMDEEDILKAHGEETAIELISRNMPRIREIADAARSDYLTYTKKSGLKRGEKCAVVDFIATGSTQMYLSKFLPFHFKGFYFGRYDSTETDQCEIEFYLQGDNKTLLRNYIELESFFSAPEPSVNCITSDGGVEFQPEMRTDQEIDNLKYVLDKSELFARTFFEVFYEEGTVIRPVLPEEMFAADGYHWVQNTAYEDWLGRKIETRRWRDAGN